MKPLSRFGISLGIFDSDNREEIYELLNRNGFIDDIVKLPDVGAFVVEILEQSQAQKVGFQQGDLILKLDGKLGMEALNLIETTPFREFSEVEVLRQNHTEIIEIKDRL